jgi:predicted ribosomally synthesized peptide with SipW-like signal peptide
MSKKTKRYLMLLVAVGLIAVAAGGSGTFASFSAETANNGNYFATGTLFLHNFGGTTTCTSESDTSGNANILAPTGCDVLFSVNPVTEGGDYPASLKLTNAGSINAQNIQFSLGSGGVNGCLETRPTIATLGTGFAASDPITTLSTSALSQALVNGTQITVDDGVHAAQTFTVAVTANTGSTSIDVVDTTAANILSTGAKIVLTATFGVAPTLCADMQVYVQETAANYTTPLGCAYGTFIGSTCTFSATKTIGGANGIGNGYVPLTLATGGGDNNGLQRLDKAGSRYFVIHVKAPTPFTNAYQNDQVSFDLKWKINQ